LELIQPSALNTPIVRIDPRYFRPTEVDVLIGDPTKAKSKLGWEPKYNLSKLVSEMMESDIQLFNKDRFLLKNGPQSLEEKIKQNYTNKYKN
jgi:GDPmannose 4,6-dehydratase